MKKGFGIESVPREENWELLFSHAMADRLARELMAMAPLQRFMQRMRAQAEHAQQEAVREREEANRAAEEGSDAVRRAAGVRARSADEFEF